MTQFKKFRLLIILVSVLAVSLPVHAQKRVLTLEEAVGIALKNNRDVKIAQMNVSKAEAAVRQAYGYALPTVDLNASYYRFLMKPKMAFPDFASLLGNATYGILFDEGVIPRDDSKFRPVGTTLQSFVQTNNFESTVQATQILFNSAVFRGIGTSQIYLDLSKEELKRIAATTVLEVEKTFYGVLLSKELYEITEASFKNASENLGNVRALHEQGLVAEFDFLQAEVRVENIRPVLLQMENNLSRAGDGLKILLNINQAEDIDVSGEFIYEDEILPDENESIRTALEDNFSIRSMSLKLKVDEAFIALDRSDYWPTIAAFANYSYAGSSDDFKFQKYSSATVGVSFTINLFRGTQTINKVEQSEVSLNQSEEQYSQLKDYVVSQVKFRIKELRKVKASLEAQERNVKLAQRAYELAVLRYKEGTGNQLEIENSDIALRQAKINLLQSIYDYILSKANLSELLGSTDPSFINQLDFKD
jgi:outer membrane protein